MTTDLRPGDEVAYYHWGNGTAGMHSARHIKATVRKIGKHRVTIQTEDGKFKFVEPENLRLLSRKGNE